MMHVDLELRQNIGIVQARGPRVDEADFIKINLLIEPDMGPGAVFQKVAEKLHLLRA